MAKVSVNAPKTPVTEGSNGVAAATVPNMCKMPGPPAPFVPTPLPNVGKSGIDPKNYSKSVTIEGKKVAIRGATFGSMGDVASKGTGGGVVSSNVEGPTSFVGPGSMDVKIEGKNVQLLGDPMLNNCGPSGGPANAATMLGVLQPSGLFTFVTGEDGCPLCKKTHGSEAALEETQETKGSAQRLAAHLTANGYATTTMLGVVQCKCTKRYADRSGVTDEKFCTLIEKSEWHGPKTGNAVSVTKDDNVNTDHVILKFLKDRFKEHENNVKDTWVRAAERSEKYNKNRALPAAYPPGSCAAPKILMHVMQGNGHPVGITEQWFHKKGKGNKTAGKIKYRDKQSGREPEEQFDHGQTVPSCDSCNLLLPMMLCPENQKMECQHNNEDAQC